MNITTEINLGHIISLAGALIAFIHFAQGIKWDVLSIKERILKLESKTDEQTKMFYAHSLILEKLGHLERRLDKLEELKSRSSRERNSLHPD